MRRWLVQSLLAMDSWHRVMLQRSVGYHRACHVLAHYLTHGRWEPRPPTDDYPPY